MLFYDGHKVYMNGKNYHVHKLEWIKQSKGWTFERVVS